MSETATIAAMDALVARLAELEDTVRHQQARIAQLEGTAPAGDMLEPLVTSATSAPLAQDAGTPAPATRRNSRRALLKLSGAAAAASVAAMAAGATELAHPGTAHAQNDAAGFQISYSGLNNAAIEGDGNTGAWGVVGTSDSSAGVYGTSTSGVGVYGNSSSNYGVRGISSTNIGVLGTATSNHGVYGASDTGHGVGGQSNYSTGVSGTSINGTGVTGSSSNGNGVSGSATGGDGVSGISSSGEGVSGTSSTGFGVYGTSGKVGVIGLGSIGVLGSSVAGTGVEGDSSSGAGGQFSGGRAALTLIASTTAPGAPTSGAHYTGDVYVDSLYVLWVCTNGATPGTWVRLTSVASGTPGGAVNYLSAPIRIFDSRVGQPAPLPTTKAPLAAGSTTTIQVTGTTVGGLSVPAGATGVIGNLTVTDTRGGGDLIMYPAGALQPLTSNINYAGGQTVANSVNVGLSSGGAVELYVHVNGTDVIIDVAGYVM